MKRIAIVGAGISGLAAAYFLSRRHRVWLFEKETRLGGHTHTVLLPRTTHDGLAQRPKNHERQDGETPLALDTGFLVHNDRTYPNLVRLFAEIGLKTYASDMCFAVSCRRTGLEYSSRGARGFFAQRRNLFRPSHLRLLKEIVRFNREAPSLLDAPDADRLTLGDFLESRRFGDEFTHTYLFPIASAVWSSSLDSIRSFPALTLVRFFDNHGMLGINTHPRWKVVAGGSHTYIPKLTAPLADRIVRGAPIRGISRGESGVHVSFFDRQPMAFDDIVFACHGDQVLPLLADATDGLSVPRIALRHRLQTDTHGLDRSRHRIVADGGPLVLELDAHGWPAPQVLGAVIRRFRDFSAAEDAVQEALLAATDLVVHGTTTADNTMIEMSGATTGLITSEGHRDEIEIRRGYKEDIWDPAQPPPPPICPRCRRK